MNNLVTMPLEVKEWTDYNYDEKRAILIGWWNFKPQAVSLDVDDYFLKLLDECIDDVWFVAVHSFILGKHSELLYSAIQLDEVAELLIQAKMTYFMALQNKDQSLDDLIEAQENLLNELSRSYVFDKDALVEPTI